MFVTLLLVTLVVSPPMAVSLTVTLTPISGSPFLPSVMVPEIVFCEKADAKQLHNAKMVSKFFIRGI